MRTVIIGGGACGASAAARIRRLDESAEIIGHDPLLVSQCNIPKCAQQVCLNNVNLLNKLNNKIRNS